MMSLHAMLIAPFETLGFMRSALVACLALALANGVLGTLLVLRRMSLDGDVLGHAVMPGAAVGFLYAGPSPTWLSLGGLASGLAVAALAGLAGGGRARHDAGLVAFYLVALSLGVVLVAWRGSNVDVMRVLFGTVLAIDRPALLQIATASSVILVTIAALYRPFAVGAFDPAFLRAVASRAPYGPVFVALVVLALVASFQAFGTLLAIGPMLLPAAAARCWKAGVAASMTLAIGFGAIASVAGLLISYHGNLPSGPAIVLAGGLLYGVSFIATGAEEEHPVSGRQLPSAIDQHAWLDPRNGVIYVRNIADALARLDPPNASDYRARAAAYTKEIQALDDWARKELGSVPSDKRRVLTSHDSLQYLANAYGITLLTVNGWTNNSEPSAAELAKLSQRIRAAHVKALFLDSITDPRAMQRIAGETGAEIGGTLYGDTLSPPGGEADTYLDMVRHDVTTLKAGMLRN
jgi:zinc/manganese transport system permease protein